MIRLAGVVILLWGGLTLCLWRISQPLDPQAHQGWAILIQNLEDESYSAEHPTGQLWPKLQSVRQSSSLFLFIETLPPEIGQLDHLETLDMGSTPLLALPPDIGQLHHLRVLYLYDTPLKALPPEVGQLVNLEEVDLSSTPLMTLPPEIGQWRQVRILNLARTPLQTIPPEVGQMEGLLHLNLSHTQMTALPPEIGQLDQLQILDLTGTPITTLPPEIGYLDSLGALYVNETQLDLPQAVLEAGAYAIQIYLRMMDLCPHAAIAALFTIRLVEPFSGEVYTQGSSLCDDLPK